MRAGQADRQLDLAEGRRGGVPASREAGEALRRGRRRHGVRREGTGRHAPAQDVDRAAQLRSARRQGGLSARGHRHRPERVRDRHRHRRAQQLRGRLHRRDALDQGAPAAREGVGRHLERQLQLPRQRAGARGDPHGVPLPRDPRGADDGHRQRRSARRLRRARPALRDLVEDVVLNRKRADGASPDRNAGQRSPSRTRRRGASRKRTSRGANGAVEARLSHALVKGIGNWIVEDTEAARARGGRARRQADRGDRGPADGRHERRRRPLRRRARCSCRRS